MAVRLGYHHAALRVRDFDRSLRFYEAIGCKLIRVWGEGEKKACMLDIGGGNILEMFAGGTALEEENARFWHIALKSEDVPGDYENALKAGAKPRTEPGEGNIGGDYPIAMAFVFGPSGEVIEFFQER